MAFRNYAVRSIFQSFLIGVFACAAVIGCEGKEGEPGTIAQQPIKVTLSKDARSNIMCGENNYFILESNEKTPIFCSWWGNNLSEDITPTSGGASIAPENNLRLSSPACGSDSNSLLLFSAMCWSDSGGVNLSASCKCAL